MCVEAVPTICPHEEKFSYPDFTSLTDDEFNVIMDISNDYELQSFSTMDLFNFHGDFYGPAKYLHNGGIQSTINYEAYHVGGSILDWRNEFDVSSPGFPTECITSYGADKGSTCNEEMLDFDTDDCMDFSITPTQAGHKLFPNESGLVKSVKDKGIDEFSIDTIFSIDVMQEYTGIGSERELQVIKAHEKVFDIPDNEYLRYIYMTNISEELELIDLEDSIPKLWSVFTDNISYYSAPVVTNEVSFTTKEKECAQGEMVKVESENVHDINLVGLEYKSIASPVFDSISNGYTCPQSEIEMEDGRKRGSMHQGFDSLKYDLESNNTNKTMVTSDMAEKHEIGSQHQGFESQENARSKSASNCQSNSDDERASGLGENSTAILGIKSAVPKLTHKERRKRLKEIQNDQKLMEEGKYNPDERYEDVKSHITEKFDPDVDISTTYLWEAENTIVHSFKADSNSMFETGYIPASPYGLAHGKLLDGTKLNILIDSGASKPMMSRRFFNSHTYLHKYPRYKIKPRYLRVANEQLIEVNECLHMMLDLGGCIFETIVYLSIVPAPFDFIIGQKFMYETEAAIDFGKTKFFFKKRSVDLINESVVDIGPNEQKGLTLRLKECPVGFNDALSAIIKLRQPHGEIPVTLSVSIEDKKVYILVKNTGNDILSFSTGDHMGCLDMRSVGYFHTSRDNLQIVLQGHCHFLNDVKSLDFSKKMVNAKPVERFCTSCQTRLRERMNKGEKDTNMVPDKDVDPYPWLNEDDPRRTMTDKEIILKNMGMSEACLSEDLKEQWVNDVLKNKDVFSLRDEIGVCPHMEVELEFTDTTPFFIRPYPISESEKPIIDREMKKGVLLGILRKGMSSYSSPIMLIPRKLSGIPRIVTDFRHLNTRLKVLNPSIPLVRDAIQMIGSSGCEILSVIDLRDAYHTLRLSPKSQEFCGITPYYGSDTYLYQRLGMGLSVSPAIWQTFINQVLHNIPDNDIPEGSTDSSKATKKHLLAIMDDVCCFSKMEDHRHHLLSLFDALRRNGLKISLKKCQFWRKKLVYMGHHMLIENNIPFITPLKTRLEAVEKLGPLKTPKNCKQFCGMVNYLAMYLKDLQKTLIPIYNLTKKGMPFHWGKEEQTAYDKVKQQLVTPPVLVMPNSDGHFILVSDTSKIACGSALYQEQANRYRLVAYYSKKLPDACSRYSISELEFTGLLACISAFRHMLKNVVFTVYVDHSALVHMLKGKREPATLRIKKLLEQISEYSFKINYLKGKDMNISDFLSRHPDNDEGSPNEIIPIAFQILEELNMIGSFDFSILCTSIEDFTYLDDILDEHMCDGCYVTTRSQTKDVHVPNIYPLQHDVHRPEHSKKDMVIDLTKKIEIHTEEEEKEGKEEEEFINEEGNEDELEELDSLDIPEINEEDKLDQLPHFDSKKIFELSNILPSDEDLNKRKEQLLTFIRHQSIFRKHIPKQHELNKFLDGLKRTVIHDFSLPVTAKEIRAEYKNSPLFKDIIRYLKTSSSMYKGYAHSMLKQACEDYILMEGLLFKFRYNRDNEPSLVLCVPEKYIPTILHQYHSIALAGHPGANKLYLQLREKFFFFGLYDVCRQYVISCFDCQSRKDKSNNVAVTYPRIPLDYKPMSKFSMDIKTMMPSDLGFKYVLLCTCEGTNYVIGISLANIDAQTIAEAIFCRIICIYGTPEEIIVDQGRQFVSALMTNYLDALHVQSRFISVMNHGSNKTERYIKTLNTMINKYLTGKGIDWPRHVLPCCYAMNCQISLVTGYSPYEMVFLRKPPSLLDFEIDPDRKGISVTVIQYMNTLKDKLEGLKKMVLERKIEELKTQWIREMRKHPLVEEFCEGDLVYLNYEYGSNLQTASKKLKQEWIGPLRIAVILDVTHYLVSDWEGLLLPIKVHKNRLKQYHLNLGNITPDGMLNLARTTQHIRDRWQELQEASKEVS